MSKNKTFNMSFLCCCRANVSDSDQDEMDESNEESIENQPDAQLIKDKKKTDDKIPKMVHQFIRPDYMEPRHTLLSSPFGKLLMTAAAGPVKPVWYKAPSFDQFYAFKHLIHLIEDARERPIYLLDLVQNLQDLCPTITTQEVLYIIKNLDCGKESELDFGEFLFLLANNPFYEVILRAPTNRKYILNNLFSPRHRVLYSSMAFHCLVQTEDDIQKFYVKHTKQHGDILKYHMAAQRNLGLSEIVMEKKQKQVKEIVKIFSKGYHSPYTAPVPLVKATEHQPHYKDYLKRKATLNNLLLPEVPKMATDRNVTPLKGKRPLGQKVERGTDEDELIKQFKYAHLPRPDMRIPAKRLKEMRTCIRADQNQYLQLLKEKALQEYYDHVKVASVAYSKRRLKVQLKKGFPDVSSKAQFFNMYKSYMPLSLNEFFALRPWTPERGVAEKSKKKFERPPFGMGSH